MQLKFVQNAVIAVIILMALLSCRQRSDFTHLFKDIASTTLILPNMHFCNAKGVMFSLTCKLNNNYLEYSTITFPNALKFLNSQLMLFPLSALSMVLMAI